MDITPVIENISKLSLNKEELQQFNEQGYAGPFTLFKEGEIKGNLMRCASYPTALLPWRKSRHAAVKEMAAIGMNPLIVDKIVSILGENILLWGSQIIKQKPLKRHNIHIDLEHTAWEGVTVWLALKNVVSKASFHVIPGSHLFNLTVENLKDLENNKLKTDEAYLHEAKKINPNSKLKYLNIKNGQFIIFSGKLWHGTQNITPDPRFSMIFQYTKPESEVKIPKDYSLTNLTWYRQKPQCLLVNGKDNFKINRVIQLSDIDITKSYLQGIFYYLPLNSIRKIKDVLKT